MKIKGTLWMKRVNPKGEGHYELYHSSLHKGVPSKRFGGKFKTEKTATSYAKKKGYIFR